MSPDSTLGEHAFLSAYRAKDFPPFAVTVDLAIFTIRAGILSALLIQRAEHPFKDYWALPGGFVRQDEDLEEAARRELAEETGGSTFAGHLEQLRTYGSPDRDPRMRVVSVAYVALAPNLPEPTPGGDAHAARWWPVQDLDPGSGSANPEDGPLLAFDHSRIVADAVTRIQAKLEYTTLATQFVTEPFTLADLRRVYLAIWGSAPDPANFRRKVLGTDGFVALVERSDVSAAGAAGGRPPLLYQAGHATELHPPILRT